MASVRSVLRYPADKKKLFAQSRCLLTISVGQEAHEGEKFQTVVELVNRSFQSCILLVDHSLQRHTMAEESIALCLWPELNCHCEVYSGKCNMALAATYEKFVFPVHPDLLQAVAVKYINRKQFKPQLLTAASDSDAA